MNRQTWIAVVVLVAIATVYVVFIRKTEEDRIRAQLQVLCNTVHQDEGDNLLLRAARIERTFPHLFVKEVELHVPEVAEGRRPRHELSTIAAGVAKRASKIELRFSKVHVEIDRPPQRAWVMADATVVATVRGEGGYQQSKQLAMRFDKDEDEWKIADIALQGAGAK